MSLEIRQANAEDISAIAHIHVSGWQTSGEGIVDPDYLKNLSVSDRVSEWEERFQSGDVDMLLAVEDGKPIGFINYGPLRTAPPGTSKIRPAYSSEIYAIYILPDFFRQGIGTLLMHAAVNALQDKKHQSMCLWVLKGNNRACQFYDQKGGQRIGKKDVIIGPTKAKELCYGWRDISVITDRK